MGRGKTAEGPEGLAVGPDFLFRATRGPGKGFNGESQTRVLTPKGRMGQKG